MCLLLKQNGSPYSSLAAFKEVQSYPWLCHKRFIAHVVSGLKTWVVVIQDYPKASLLEKAYAAALAHSALPDMVRCHVL